MRLLKIAALVGVVVFLAIQFVPYGRAHDNPPATQPVEWSNARTEKLFEVACADCHSSETEWPWYTNIAPQSWFVQRDVDGGRDELNLSEMDKEQKELKDIAEVVVENEMPPLRYTLLHPDARLSEAEKRVLIEGLSQTFGDEVERD
jgi:mono/diheme cytochrome c family protein